MADVQHSALTDPELHEPKGAAAATSGQIYVANGSGSGTWKKVTGSEIDSTATPTVATLSVTGALTTGSITNPITMGGVTINVGAGSPESAVTANVGSIYLRTNGGASTTLYVKESGTGNTGWIAK